MLLQPPHEHGHIAVPAVVLAGDFDGQDIGDRRAVPIAAQAVKRLPPADHQQPRPVGHPIQHALLGVFAEIRRGKIAEDEQTIFAGQFFGRRLGIAGKIIETPAPMVHQPRQIRGRILQMRIAQIQNFLHRKTAPAGLQVDDL